ncbi:toprim domain-containing protein [Methylobacterium organophilum]|jgi:putative DNA primase/helicase|uniref:DUF7146 domain-containing protein n=1 Tax=Methylobacterium organophilum TaxID=410 RepID=UPI0019D12176|nr:toprim domain-containing protein [Methylobacterium organophilum]MBN6823990.1 toprim domain-containing protein [Methylobacterium organophilum]
MDLRTIAQALGGEVASGQVLAPAPGHSPRDRSLSVKLSPTAPAGVVVHLFAGGDVLAAKDHVLATLGLRRTRRPVGEERTAAKPPIARPDETARTRRALEIWDEARDPEGSPVLIYLRSRGIALPDGAAGAAVRFHPSCPFAGPIRTPAMVCLVRDVLTDAPKAIHRTALDRDGRKVEISGKSRLALGAVAGGAIKFTAESDVAGCLGVGEGVESALSLQLVPEFGRSPVWSLLSANGIERLPVLPGIESLWLAVDHDDAGLRASRVCSDRWERAGIETYLVRPRAPGSDLNDVVGAASDA